MIKTLINWLMPKPDWDKYIEQFIQPHFNRGLEHGIPRYDLDKMLQEAINESTVHKLPGMIFRDAVDARINDKE